MSWLSEQIKDIKGIKDPKPAVIKVPPKWQETFRKAQALGIKWQGGPRTQKAIAEHVIKQGDDEAILAAQIWNQKVLDAQAMFATYQPGLATPGISGTERNVQSEAAIASFGKSPLVPLLAVGALVFYSMKGKK